MRAKFGMYPAFISSHPANVPQMLARYGPENGLGTEHQSLGAQRRKRVSNRYRLLAATPKLLKGKVIDLHS